jgi:hypothetical protein
MKQTVNASNFVDTIERLRPNNFSREALHMMFEYFEQYEEDVGTEIDFDPIGICCEYVEQFPSEIVHDYQLTSDIDGLDQDQMIKFIQEYLEEQCIFIGITSHGSFVYQQF